MLLSYLPPVLVVSLRFLGGDSGPEPQAAAGVQGPHCALLPEGDADGLQTLALTNTHTHTHTASEPSL